MNRDLGVWTYEDCALVLVDYQKEIFEVIRSETGADLIDLNVRLLPKAAPTATNQAERPTLRADARRKREALLEATRHGFECQMEDIAGSREESRG